MANPADKFDENEKPTAPHARPDANATTRMAKIDLDALVQKESGTRRVVTAEQIDAYVREKSKPAIEAVAAPVAVAAAAAAVDPQSTAQQIPIDVDLTGMTPIKAGVDRQKLIAVIAVIAVVLSALVGFVVGRLSL